MLLHPRIYRLAQTPDRDTDVAASPFLRLLPSPDEHLAELKRAKNMLLVHQTGSVRVGEVVRCPPPPARFAYSI
jgi:hypothetical protein